MSTRCQDKEPLAIVGIGCRFPGAAGSPEAFWQLLLEKRDAMRDVPRQRWDLRQFYDPDPEKAGKAYNRQGGFLEEDIELFDPLFFGISPREARIMDPQQRLLLEVTWEAFEDAGLTREALAGSQTGVFVGGFWLDHQINQFGVLNIDSANTHTPVSATLTLLSNRLSYVFDLRGPSLTVDTACSSSLVAAHYACQSLWNRECAMALIGGVNVMTSPSSSIGLSKGKFLSAHSRCMTFDERASGYARGEGAAVVLVMPWSAAQAYGLPAYALIRATGVNQDGQTPGITLPNPEAQQMLMRKVYAEAGVAPSEIQYIEAHGTGTQAGDLAESQALQAVFSEGRAGKLLVGSVKTNMGHLEAAAGMAGMIKAALSLKHGKVPANLHFEKPNPRIPFDRICLEVPTETREWPAAERRFAGVNSFGYGGTNAHLLLEAAPAEAPRKQRDAQRTTPALVPVSGQSEAAVKAAAGRLAEHLRRGGADFEDILRTLCRHRSHLDVRSYAVAGDLQQLQAELEKISQGLGPELALVAEEKGLVFVYTGMGPQWWSMGRTLYKTAPVYRKTVEACDAAFRKLSGWSILEAMLAPETESRMAETQIAQPANFVLQAGLTELLAAWGVKPAAIVGHSVGEVAAAYAAGALSLEDAVRVSYHRSRLQQTLAGNRGGMLAINLPEAEAKKLFGELQLELSIAAVNAWNSVTVSGDREELEKFASHLTQLGQFNRSLKVEIAYHSRQMDPIRSEFIASLDGLQPQAAAVPLYSTVSGTRVAGAELGSDYWWQNVRQPVRFQAGVQALLADGFKHFLEVGPHPVLAQSIQAEGLRQKRELRLSATLNRKQPELETFLQALGQLFQWGYPLAWNGQLDPAAGIVRLPNYPWQRERYWYELETLREYRIGREGHVLLNRTAAGPDPAWEVELNAHYLPYLADHRIGNQVVVPGALYVEAGLAARQQLGGTFPLTLENVRFHHVCNLKPDKVQRLHTRYHRSSGAIEIFSTSKDEGATWQHHATLDLATAATARPADVELAAMRAQCSELVDAAEFYRLLEKRRLNYGPYFKPITRIWRGEGRVMVEMNPSALPEAKDGYLFGPTILDALFQSLILVNGPDHGNADSSQTYIPVAIERVTLFAQSEMPCFGWVTLAYRNEKTLKGDARLVAADGTVIAEVSGVICQHLAQNAGQDAADPEWFYEWLWQPEPRPAARRPAGEQWLLVGGPEGDAAELAKQLEIRGIATVLFRSGESIGRLKQQVPEAAIAHAVFLDTATEMDFSRMSADCMNLAALLQTYFAPDRKDLAWSVVTRGLHSMTAPNPQGAPAWGVARVVRNEYPNILCRCIDLDLPAGQDLPVLAEELLIAASNEEVALGPSGRLVHRLQRIQGLATAAETCRVSADQPLALKSTPEGLRFEALAAAAPGAGEVEVKVQAALLSKMPVGLDSLAREGRLCEFSGTISAVGEGVRGWAPGDAVAVLGPTQFATVLRVPASAIHRGAQPLRLAGIAAAFGLFERVRLQKGERLLLHRAMHECGLAAAELARAAGAEAVAVCENEQEKLALADWGVQGVLISEPVAIPAADVLLTFAASLPEPVAAALKPFGRLLQIGGEPAQPGLLAAAARKNATLAVLNLKRMLEEDPEGLNQMAAACREQASALSFAPRAIPLAELPEALAAVQDQQASVSYRIEVQGRVDVVQPQQLALVRADASYLVTGGTNGFGLEVARWLAGMGAGEVILASRSGAQRPETAAAAESLRRQGCRVTVLAADVADAGAVATMMAAVRQNSLPLRGVVHSAMVLDDAYIRDLKPDQVERVLSPKIKGAMHLDAATRGMELDFFVMFSSISALIGNPGQANYAAANAFLDALAHARQAAGRKALAVNWGVLSESGVVARNQQVATLLANAGIKGFNNRQALNALGRALTQSLPQVGVFDVDWPAWLEQNPAAGQWPSLGKLATARKALNPKVAQLIADLQSRATEERAAALEQNIAAVISQVVKIPEKTIQRNQNIMNYGVDSLMALDLARSLKADLGLELGMMDLMNGPTVSHLADLLLAQFEPHFQEQLIEKIDEMSEAELDALLAAEMDTAKP